MTITQKDEGLVLRSMDYKERQKIITLFTPSYGMISLIVKGVTRKRSHLLTLTSPFTRGEYLFQIRRSTLFPFKDGTPLATHYALRKALVHIEAATALAKALLTSQLPEKPAPKLYALTRLYLEILPHFEDPSPLTASFLLKLLKHEGHLSSDKRPQLFTASEWEIAADLTQARTVSTLKTMQVSLDIQQKIEALFRSKI